MMIEKTNKRPVKHLLREHGITPTQQRVEIANFLFKNSNTSAPIKSYQPLNKVNGLFPRPLYITRLAYLQKKGCYAK